MNALLWSSRPHLISSHKSPVYRTRISASAHPPELTLLHFNDVYNIEPRSIGYGEHTVGGAARFTTMVKKLKEQHENVLVLFGGDCLNPSLISAFTKGEHMIPVMNSIGVHAAVCGNHDFDHGTDILKKYIQKESGFQFPWLLSNVLDAHTLKPLAGAHRSVMLEQSGLKIGLIGLVERDWLLTIPSIDETDIVYLDYIEEGRKLSQDLWKQGVDCVIALTHMRMSNDWALAEAVPDIQLILGGHDHDFEVVALPKHGTTIFKSGTDFREASFIKVRLPEDPKAQRPEITWHRIEVNELIEEDQEIAMVVREYADSIADRMDEPLGTTFVDLDARSSTVRNRESNLGNLFADIARLALNCDVAFLNGGTIRSDQIHTSGRLSMRDFVSMLPFTDELVVLQLTGAELLACLENSVSKWPSLEGRFLQVSGVSFEFDPNVGPGSRVSDVLVAGHPLEMDRPYSCVTKQYLRNGKDGFDMLRKAPVLIDGETAPRLATLVQFLFGRIDALNAIEREQVNGMKSRDSDSDEVSHLLQPPGPCPHGLDALYFFDASRKRHGVAPTLEGRIVCKMSG